MSDREGGSSAWRRRQRRLRSWWRHERMTVAAKLAVALHHSRGVGPPVPHEALRGQTPASSGGRRPGVLKEPEPPVVVEHAACPCSIPCLGGGADGAAAEWAAWRKWIVFVSLFLVLWAEEEEEEEEEEEASEDLFSSHASPRSSSKTAFLCPWLVLLLWYFSRCIPIGCRQVPAARHHGRQFSSCDPGSGICKAGFASFLALSSSTLSSGPRCSASWPVWTRRTFMQFVGFTGDEAPCAVLPFIVVVPKMFGIIGQVPRGVPKNCFFTGRLPHLFPYFALWFNSGYLFMTVYRQKTAEIP